MELRLHAPPERGPGAFCRYIRRANIAALPEDVTCEQCLTKMGKQGVPRRGWRMTKERAWGDRART
jgi:hypothetical protein